MPSTISMKDVFGINTFKSLMHVPNHLATFIIQPFVGTLSTPRLARRTEIVVVKHMYKGQEVHLKHSC